MRVRVCVCKYISIQTLQKSGSRFRNHSPLPRQCVTGFRQNSPTKPPPPPPTPALECLRLREFLGLPESFCFLSGFRQRFWGSFSMALNGSPIWGRVKTTPPPFSHLGISGYGSGRSGFALNLRFGSRKWECCSLAQRAKTLVDDEKPIMPVADTSGPFEKALSIESMGFHKDLNLLPSKFLPNQSSLFLPLFFFF